MPIELLKKGLKNMEEGGKALNEKKKALKGLVGKHLGEGFSKIKGKFKNLVEERKEAQRNFRNRKDDSNYFGTYKEFLPKNKK